MSDTLPLPEPVLDASEAREIGLEAIDLFDAAQMREAIQQAVEAECEACAEVAERGFRYAKDGYQIADAIRARSKA